MMKYLALISVLLWLASGCMPRSNEQAEEGESETATEAQNIEEEVVDEPAEFVVREPGDDELNEFGIITDIEDAGYPMYTVTVSFPERGSSNDFSLNAEDASLSDDIRAFQDKYATIYYDSRESNEVLDIIFNGKTLLGEYAPEDHEGLESVEGLLKGASSESGDLPDALTIEGEYGTLTFEYFLDAETMAANNQQVTVYYNTRYIEVITYMQLSVD